MASSSSSPTLPLTTAEFPILPFLGGDSNHRRRRKRRTLSTPFISFPTTTHFHNSSLISQRTHKVSVFRSIGSLFNRFSRVYCSASDLTELKVGASKGSSIEPTVHTSTWNWKGYSIRYQFSGNNGPALVLVHGFGANSDHWRKNLPVLARSHRVYAIDLIGYGYSDKPNPRHFGDGDFYTFETWGAQLNDFCADVVKDEAFFICNSIGGLVGLQAAVMEPQICEGILLLNISLRMLHIKKQPWFGRPFIRSFQNLLRNTSLGQFFFKSVATSQSVRSILCQVPGGKDLLVLLLGYQYA